MPQRHKVDQALNAHSVKAQQSSYDRDTCVLAILKAREVLISIPENLDDSAYTDAVFQAMNKLSSRYNDPDGEFTSGRGVIGALYDDLRRVLLSDTV